MHLCCLEILISLKTDRKLLCAIYCMNADLFLMSFTDLYSLVTLDSLRNSYGFGNTSSLNTPGPQSDLLALICAALEVSAPTPAITVNQPSTHCIVNRWSVSVEHITLRLFTGETWMQKLCRHGESKVTEL